MYLDIAKYLLGWGRGAKIIPGWESLCWRVDSQGSDWITCWIDGIPVGLTTPHFMRTPLKIEVEFLGLWKPDHILWVRNDIFPERNWSLANGPSLSWVCSEEPRATRSLSKCWGRVKSRGYQWRKVVPIKAAVTWGSEAITMWEHEKEDGTVTVANC